MRCSSATNLQRLGAQLSARSRLDVSTVFLSAIKPKLDDSLALFADVVLNPSFPDADFQREKKLMLARIEQEKAQPVPMAERVLPGLIYGKGHAYGNPLTGSGTPESVAKIGREDLVKFHSTWFRPNGATLLLPGTQRWRRFSRSWRSCSPAGRLGRRRRRIWRRSGCRRNRRFI